MPTPAQNPLAAAVVYREGAVVPITPQPVSETPQDKGAALRTIFAAAKPGDLIQVGFGSFDFGNTADVVLPAGVTIRGMGAGQTTFKSAWYDDDGIKRIAFKLGNGTTLEDVSLSHAATEPAVDGICVGFAASGISATLRRVAVFGREWGVYSWVPDCNLLVEDFEITAGRVCVASENSGDGDSVTLRRGRIIGDASLSQCSTNLDVSNPNNGGIFGVVHRGGDLRMSYVDLEIKGAPQIGYPTGLGPCARACAITDTGGDNSAPAGNTRFDLFGVRSSVNANGALAAWDLDVQADYVQQNIPPSFPNCWGAGTDGALLRSW